MSLKLAVQGYLPAITPNAVIAKVTTPTANSYTEYGEPCSLIATNFTDPNDLGLSNLPLQDLPLAVDVIVEVTALTTGSSVFYAAAWVPGTTLSNGKLQLFVAGSEFSGTWSTWNGYGVTIYLIIYMNPSDE